MKQKASSLKNKQDNRILTHLTKMSRKKTKISKIRNAKVEKTKNTMEIQGTISEYFENLYSNKCENLEEMEKFLSTYYHPKWN
jgi:hypothetical protein